MAKFKTRVRTVEAFQLTAENIRNRQLIPEWGRKSIYSMSMIGWWITPCLDARYDIELKTPEEFAAEYEPADEGINNAKD